MRVFRISRLLMGVSMGVVSASPTVAETLQDALISAYKTNPTLSAQRAALNATDESVAIAKADGRPSLQSQSNYSENVLTAANSFVAPSRQITSQASISLPIYSGGLVRNSIKGAETRVLQGRATLRGTESDLFVGVVQAYMNVIRDQAIVGLNEQNLRVLETNLQASKDRFQVGDLTRTDVAQSEARLAQARANLQSAEANLITSRETYIRLVGAEPGDLAPPPELPKLPAGPDEAVQTALADSPALDAARKAADAGRYDVRVARAARLPKVSVSAGGNYANYLGTFAGGVQPQQYTQAQAGLTVTLPLYQGGRPAAQVRQAEARESQAIELKTEAERGVVSQVRSAYALWRSSLDVIQSSIVAVNANKLSLEGVRAENSVGNRTILEILNAEQELLSSQVQLVTARRDAYVAGFMLLAATGHAEMKDLGLDGGPLYSPVAHYEHARRQLSDWADGPRAEAIAPSTAQTRAQDAKVKAGLAPLLDAPADSAPVDRSGPNPANIPPSKQK